MGLYSHQGERVSLKMNGYAQKASKRVILLIRCCQRLLQKGYGMCPSYFRVENGPSLSTFRVTFSPIDSYKVGLYSYQGERVSLKMNGYAQKASKRVILLIRCCQRLLQKGYVFLCPSHFWVENGPSLSMFGVTFSPINSYTIVHVHKT